MNVRVCFIYAWASYPAPHVYLSNNNAYQPNTNGPIGSSTPLTSNACAIQLSASSASFSGNNFTLNLMITFQAAYAGNYTHWLWVDDWQGNTANPQWDDFGAWTIPTSGGGGGSPAPQLTSLTPASGNTYGPQNFTFVFTDPQGANNVQQIQVMLSGPAAGCYAYIWVDSAWVYLADNSGNAWAGSGGLGSAASPLSNSQCRISLVNSS